ncbi:FliH/SctL family protein [Actinotalea sp. AC32]|nr:FliH/SctL family protein [Actinotalea sp. AC32]
MPDVTTFRPAALPASSAAGEAAAERARAAGYAAGWAAGSRAAADAAERRRRELEEQHAHAEAARDAAVQQALALLEQAVSAAARRTVPTVDAVRRSVHEAALDLAEAVLDRELRPGPDSARALLDRVLATPADLGVHTVRLHPADLAAVRALLDAGRHALPAGVTLVGDSTVRPGGAVSEHATGFLDAQVDTALDRARRALLEDEA